MKNLKSSSGIPGSLLQALEETAYRPPCHVNVISCVLGPANVSGPPRLGLPFSYVAFRADMSTRLLSKIWLII